MSTIRQSSIYRYGLEAISKRLRQYRKAQSGDVQDREYVHELRVASRRVRAAFALFEPLLPPDHAAAWRKALKHVTKQLGAARDLDVQLVFLEAQQQLPCEESYALLFNLHFRSRHERAGLDAGIGQTMAECDAWIADLERFLRTELEELPPRKEEVQDTELIESAAQCLRTGWREVRRCESRAFRRDEAEYWHELRIAIKKYRYMVEIFKKLFAPDVDEPLSVLKKAQDELGEHQDASVWIERLKKEECRKTLACSGLRKMLKERRAEQGEALQRFQMLWADAKSSGVWKTWRNAMRLHAVGVPVETEIPAKPNTPEVTPASTVM